MRQICYAWLEPSSGRGGTAYLEFRDDEEFEAFLFTMNQRSRGHVVYTRTG